MTVKNPALAVVAFGLTLPARAYAHPEFSALGANRYVTAAIFDGRVDVTDALLDGALVSGEERRRLDADGDGTISDAERGAGEARLAAEGAWISVEIDGRAVTAPVTVSIDLGDDVHSGAAPLVVERRLSFPGAWSVDARRLRLLVVREPARLLDTEIGLVAGPGYALARGEDRVTFRGPRTSTLEERAATFELTGPPSAAPAKARSAFVAVVGVLAAGVLAMLAWRRARATPRA
ncbi:MAG TPA: hypothetical protein VHK47_20435 [Polyangia bacterium]|jgi:hypothetical protein|nr:hypothetical protein [Polyangia bacterium]